MNEQPVPRTSKSNYEITRTKAIKALSALWDIAFPERSGERCQEWAETNHLCAIWDPDSLEDQQDAMPPGIWDLMLALGVTPAELIEHCHANPKLFEGSPTNETCERPANVWRSLEMPEDSKIAYRDDVELFRSPAGRMWYRWRTDQEAAEMRSLVKEHSPNQDRMRDAQTVCPSKKALAQPPGCGYPACRCADITQCEAKEASIPDPTCGECGWYLDANGSCPKCGSEKAGEQS